MSAPWVLVKQPLERFWPKSWAINFMIQIKKLKKKTGANIPWIFDVEGESGFRDRESAVIKELSELKKVVLATGGGAMMRPENRGAVSKTGFVIYLNTSVDQQFHRTHKDRNRPLLQGKKDPYQVLSELYELRDPIYRAVADLIIDTDKKALKTIVRDIVSALNKPELS